MKKFLVVAFVASFFVAGPAFAQNSMMGNASSVVNQTNTAIDSALSDIYKSQNITSLSQINCNKVSDDQLEKLGDASMGYGISEEQHTAMENMMGGEGTATVKTAHINMGRAYLGCWSGFNSAPIGMSMMSSGMMNGSSMSLYGAHAAAAIISVFLLWTLSILGIITLVKHLKKRI